MKVSIIGTGQIGKDLLYKLKKLSFIKVVAFVGKRKIKKEEFSETFFLDDIIFSEKSIDFFISNPKCCDIVFDCTDAYSAVINSKIFKEQQINVIDLTPSNLGNIYIPNITLVNKEHLNMVTCGAQASLPVMCYLKNIFENIEYFEVVTQISSESAGIATRNNVDKYIETTENAISKLTGVNSKVILNLNPSNSSIMKTTIYVVTQNENDFCNFDNFDNFVKSVQKYVPKYNVESPVKISSKLYMVHINIIGTGDFISQNYGNLDIINCAAIYALKELCNKI
jgi:acetaldehyde dehydrogenase